jgi:hypothetical protein
MLYNLKPSHPHYNKLKHIEQQVRSSTELTKQLFGFAQGGKYDLKPASMNEIT